ncbi:MAG: EAL domain-containing protein [Spirochaetales bacterium]|nr:EAL domain-containing protein [Spirochaetales bacterium]
MDNNVRIDSASLFEHLKSAVIQIDNKGAVLYVNNPCLAMFGYTKEELIHQSILRLLARDYHREFRYNLFASLMKRVGEEKRTMKRNTILKAKHKKGRLFSVELTLICFLENNKRILLIIIDDLSLFESLQEMLRVSKSNYITLAENAAEAIVQIDKDFIIKYANIATEKVFYYKKKELLDNHVRTILPGGGFEQYRSIFEKASHDDAGKKGFESQAKSLEIIGRRKDNHLFPLEVSFGSWIGKGDDRTLTFIMRDITSRKKTEKHLKHLAYHDKLTALGNRDLFDLYLKEILQEMKREPGKIAALLFLDLDGFKKVNDTLGHTVGDKILIECSQRINKCLRTNDHIYRFSDALDMDRFTDLYRFGGDEFVILLPEIRKKTDAAFIGQRIIDSIKQRFPVEGSDLISEVSLGCSIGIALIPQDGADINTLVRNADMAMYKAKETGNSFSFFTEEMNQTAIENLILEMEIRKALEHNEFALYYQPIVNEKGTLIGVEALLRWKHPDKGLVLPSKYLPFAEKYGLFDLIGNWVIKTACRQAREWRRNFHPDFYVSINVSVKQFERYDFIRSITNIIHYLKLDPGRIKLEITESHLMKNPEKTIATIRELKHRNRGISIALDDFGTGYSSLSYLSTLPIDIIKIDRSFITKIEKTANQKIVNTILMLAKGLGMEVIAEGVETGKALEILVSRGITLFQGKYISKAVPSEEITAMLVKGNLKIISPPIKQ